MDTDPLSLINNFGLPLAFALMFLFGWIVPKWTFSQARADRDKALADLAALQKSLLDDVVPALTRSTDAVARSTDLMENLARRQVGGA